MKVQTERQADELTRASHFNATVSCGEVNHFLHDQALTDEIKAMAHSCSRNEDDEKDLIAEAWEAICELHPASTAEDARKCARQRIRLISDGARRVRRREVGGVECARSIEMETESVELLTCQEVADMLSVSRGALYKMILRQQVPFVRIGKHIRFERTAIIGWIKDRRVPASERGTE